MDPIKQLSASVQELDDKLQRSERELTSLQKASVQRYVLHLLAPGGIALFVIGLVIGYVVNDIAKKEALVSALEKVFAPTVAATKSVMESEQNAKASEAAAKAAHAQASASATAVQKSQQEADDASADAMSAADDAGEAAAKAGQAGQAAIEAGRTAADAQMKLSEAAIRAQEVLTRLEGMENLYKTYTNTMSLEESLAQNQQFTQMVAQNVAAAQGDRPAALYRLLTNQQLGTGEAVATIKFDDKIFDTDNAGSTDVSGWKYSAPRKGIYAIAASLYLAGRNSMRRVDIMVRRANGTEESVLLSRTFTQKADEVNDDYVAVVSGSTLLELDAGDVVTIRGGAFGPAPVVDHAPNATWVALSMVNSGSDRQR